MALMLAAGKSTREVATTLGFSENRVGIIKGSPLFQALMRQEQGHLRAAALAGIADRLNGQADPTLTRLVELRDQPADLKVALGASNSLADRIPALSRRVRTEEDRTIRVVFGAAEVRQMIEASAEDGVGTGEVIDVQAHQDESNGVSGVAGIPTLDAALAVLTNLPRRFDDADEDDEDA
jgi:hypothetical protein